MSHEEHYLHGHGEAVLASHARRTAENSAAHLLPRLRPGMRLLDVGCGPGTITAGLAERVAPGDVIGLDKELSVLPGAGAAVGEASGHSAPLPANLEFMSGDVYELPFEDASFDVVHAHQILHHLSDPVAAIREMARVSRPGGIVSLREADYGAMTWYPPEPGIAEFIEVFRAQGKANGSDLDAGRRVYSWAIAAGLRDIEPGASTWCYAAPAEREFWAGTWAERISASPFTEQVLHDGLATPQDLDRFAAAWRAWGAAEDGWFAVLHGELLASA